MTQCKSIKRLIPAVIAWTMLLGSSFLFFVFPFRCSLSEVHPIISIAQVIITIFVLSNFFCTTFIEPGIIKRANADEDKDDFRAPLYKDVLVNNHSIPMKWCPTCQFYRPPRCSHCSVCNNCIEIFDHHCPWVANCIGRRNYRHFFFFLIFLTIDMITTFTWCCLFIVHRQEQLNFAESVVAIFLMILISILIIPVVGLTAFHIVLVARGRTTNEQVTNKFRNSINPFSNGLMNNCAFTLCGPRFPRVHKSKPGNSEVNWDTSTKVYKDSIPLDVVHTNEQKLSLELPQTKRGDTVRDTEMLKRIDRAHQYTIPGPMDSDHGDDDQIFTMQTVENGTKETTFIALPKSKIEQSNSSVLSTYNDKYRISTTSPIKSNSTNELSTTLHKKSLHLNNQRQQHQQNYAPIPSKSSSINDGGMVIYYSPDAGCIKNTAKYNSESELQRYRKSSLTIPLVITAGDNEQNTELNTVVTNDTHVTKPIPFVKALEISNQIERRAKDGNTNNRLNHHHHQRYHYENNYEISV